MATCSLLGRHVDGRASRLAKQLLTVSCQARVRKYRNKLLTSGHGTSRRSRSGEVEASRGGDVVEVGAEAILNDLAEAGLLIYPRGLEE